MDGTCLDPDLPLHWGPGSNLVWKTEVPGIGHSSPIVFGDRVFLATADPENQDRFLLCFDRIKGSLRWQAPVLKAPLERKHSLNSFASCTPAADGKGVFVAFLDRDQMLVASYTPELSLIHI